MPVLLMHGGMAHGGWWGPLARALRKDLRPFALDRRGHGRSDWASVENYGWVQDLEDTERVARELEAGPWVLIGHSQGGLLSVHLALRARMRLAGLVILDSPFEPRAPALVRSGKAFRRMPQLRYPSIEAAMRRFQPYPTPHLVPEEVLREIAEQSFKPCDDGERFVSRFHWKRFQADDGPVHPLTTFPEDVARIEVPTLVLRGAASTILSRQDFERFVDTLPCGRGFEIDATTHSLHVERPSEVARAIVDFVHSL